MHQAIAMVDRFVNGGVILSTVTRRQAIREYLATQRGTINDLELGVLINAASASAAEIVAGSLQACGRARIVGERSFGKGSVQHLIHLTESKGAVKLTTSYYRLPDGRIIHRTKKNAHTDSWGVIPDIEITLTDGERHAIRESRRAMDDAFPEAASGSDVDGIPDRQPGDGGPSQIIHDRQLLAALSHLREHVDNTRTAGH
jgi:carboxyl-terminal processing protease